MCNLHKIRSTLLVSFWLFICSLTICISGCQPLQIPTTGQSISWEDPQDGQTVFGIVNLEVRIDAENVKEVRFYVGNPDLGHLITSATFSDVFNFSGDWYTQDITNGTQYLYVNAILAGNNSIQSSIKVIVLNRTRFESIPINMLKMVPANDTAPPQLKASYKNYWKDPVPLEGSINTAGAEDSPFITPDGNTLYFWFNGDEMKDVQEQVKDSNTGIYCSNKIAGTWQEPQRLFLQYFDRTGFDGAQTIRDDKLWFASIREGNYRDIDIWTADLINGRWSNWVNAGELLNKTYEIGELHITKEGTEMYFDSRRGGGKGQKDIWLIRKVNGSWQEPQNVDSINTELDEGWPFISEDGTQLWFTRLTPGPEIYRSLKVNDIWQSPELIVSNLAGEPTLDKAGNLYFVHHRFDSVLNRVTESDIYVCYVK
jgi:hypothetical protein